jgi:hypothetical protein
MLLAVRSVVTDPNSAAARAKIPKFQADSDQFVATVDQIRRQSVAKRALITEGATATKVALRETLAAAGAKISAGLVLWAEVNRNAEIAHRAHLTKTTLLAEREFETVDRAETLLLLASEHVAHLKDYAVTQERLDEFARLCEAFSDLIGRPRSIILERKLATRSLAELFQKADAQLSSMDRLCPILAETCPAFVAEYRASRSIIHVNATRTISDGELANAVQRLEEKQAAEASKQAKKANQEAEQARHTARRQEMEEKLRTAKKAPSQSSRSAAGNSSSRDRATVPAPPQAPHRLTPGHPNGSVQRESAVSTSGPPALAR